MRYRMMATYRGVPYEAGIGPTGAEVVLFAACPPPEELRFEPAPGHWRKRVVRAEIDALWESRPVGIFRGEPCIVLDDLGDRLHIAYLGTDPGRAAILGYWQVDRGVFELLAPRDEITGLAEERVERPLRWSTPAQQPDSAPAYPYGTAPWPAMSQWQPPPGEAGTANGTGSGQRAARQVNGSRPPADPLPRAAGLPPPTAGAFPPAATPPPAGTSYLDGASPDGTAPNGIAPDGIALNGTAPNGIAPDGIAPDRYASNGSRPSGGSAPQDGGFPGKDGFSGTGGLPGHGSLAQDGSLPLNGTAFPAGPAFSGTTGPYAAPAPAGGNGTADLYGAPALIGGTGATGPYSPPAPASGTGAADPYGASASAGGAFRDGGPRPANGPLPESSPAPDGGAFPPDGGAFPPDGNGRPGQDQPWTGNGAPGDAQAPGLPRPGQPEPQDPWHGQPVPPPREPAGSHAVPLARAVAAGQAAALAASQAAGHPPTSPRPAATASQSAGGASGSPLYEELARTHLSGGSGAHPGGPGPAQPAGTPPWVEPAPPAAGARPGTDEQREGRSRSARRQRVTTRAMFCELADLAAIPRHAYALEAEADGAMCLLPTQTGYEVFLAADGARHEVRAFADEEAAYFYLFGVLAAEAIRNGGLTSR